MNKEEFKEFVINQIVSSLNEKTGFNEGIDDAAYFISEKYDELLAKEWGEGYNEGLYDNRYK